MIQHPKTTWGGVLVAVGTIVLAVGNYLTGHSVDWATIVQTVLGIVGGLGLIAARDPAPK